MASSLPNTHLGKSGSFLTKPEQALLIEFVASKGENYGRFLDFCDRNEIPDNRRFTEGYFHIWVHRHRAAIQIARGRHTDVVRSESTLDKEKRVSLLEEMVVRLRDDVRVLTEKRDQIEEEVDDSYPRAARRIPSVIETRLKVEEQLSKTLDRIAKERGEYARNDEGGTGPNNEERAMMGQMLANLGGKVALPQGRRPDDVDGEFTYIEPGGERE